MKALNYKRLLEITNTVPSFRGNVNRFPIGNRKQNNKYFLRRDEDGYTVFDIVYGETWNSTEIDRLEYIRLKLEHRKFRKATGTERAQTYVMKWLISMRWLMGNGLHSKNVNTIDETEVTTSWALCALTTRLSLLRHATGKAIVAFYLSIVRGGSLRTHAEVGWYMR
jgi:hypothetical protein